MLLAELEVRHSRAVAPTRRVALGPHWLPTDPAPGYGGILLGGIVAAHLSDVPPDLREEFLTLADELEDGRSIAQPRLRHRFQADRIGLARSRHRLLGQGDALAFAFDDHGAAASQILGACYAAGRLAYGPRSPVIDCLRRGVRWRGPVGPALVTHLTGTTGAAAWSVGAFADPEQWALEVLGFADGAAPGRRDVLRRFRDLLRQAHPDHGGDRGTAAARIAELTEARRILLAS